MNKIKIFTIHHKKDVGLPVFIKYFTPIQVGAEVSQFDLGILKDNIGQNISNKNKNYAELTANYSLFRNDDFEYIGFMHYRRIFTNQNLYFYLTKNKLIFLFRKLSGYFFKKNLSLRQDHSFNISKISFLNIKSELLLKFVNNKIDKNIDVVLPLKHHFAYINFKEQFCLNHSRIHFELFNDIIIQNYPRLARFVTKVNNSNYMYPYNMFIMKKVHSDEYHEMLFDVLFKLEKLIDINLFKNYQSRIFGFLAERFFNYYIAFKKEECIDFMTLELPILFISDDLSD